MKPSATFIAAPPSEAVTTLLDLHGWEIWDEAGRDLSERIYNFGRVVDMHIDDANHNTIVLGYVFHGQFQLAVDGHDPVAVGAGMVYQLDPLIRHGVPTPSDGDMLIYLEVFSLEEAPSLHEFAQVAIDAAIALALDPNPRAEVLEFYA